MALTEQSRLLVIIPCYNEAATIVSVLEEAREHLPDADLLVVDDGSTDHTRSLALEAGARVVTLPFNLGVGGALRTGFRYAIRHGYRMALQIDGDGQHDPSTADQLLASLDGADLIIGARFADADDDYQVGITRRLVMRLLARSVARRTDAALTDVTSGFRAFGPRALSLFAAHYPAEYLGDTVEALLIASRHGLTVRQVGVAMRPRQGGAASQSSFKSVIHLLRLVPAFMMPARLKPEFPAVEESP
ncbi:glycosyltransferase family 2 protein [Flexivirga alba]|uniref:Glycosyltransferase family 2 protein n=1 Tax=Flexivirga alba TaxID=702742 RepID=A0ABW2ADX5_9MICO